MKHLCYELFTRNDVQGVFTAEAVKGLEGVRKLYPRPENKNGYIRVYLDKDKTEFKLAYTYGEKTWFDTAEERDEYRAQQNKERELNRERNAVLKNINEALDKMDVKQLEKALAILKERF